MFGSRWVRHSAKALAQPSGKASWSRQLLDGGLQVERSHSVKKGQGLPSERTDSWVLIVPALSCII